MGGDTMQQAIDVQGTLIWRTPLAFALSGSAIDLAPQPVLPAEFAV